jgi:all-trans-retinol 13,14-reductase
MMPPGRAVVIGSGLAGLSSAVLLAEAGWAVTVLEAHTIPGGLMQRYRRDGRWFDTGFHLATGGAPGSILRAMCARLGIADQLDWLAPDPQAQVIASAPGVAPVAVPEGIAGAEQALSERFPEQTVALARFFILLRGRMVVNPWLGVLAPGVVPVDLPATPSGECSVSQALEACGVTGPAAVLLGAASSILAMQAERCPFDAYAAFAGTTFAGGYRLRGGGEGLVRPLLARLQSFGGHLLLRREAKAITHDGLNARQVVDRSGAEHPADLVITAVHPDVVHALLGPGGTRPSFATRLAEVPDSAGAVMLAASLDRPATVLGRSHHFLRLADGGDAYAVAPDLWEPGLPPSLEAMVWIPAADMAAWRDSRLGKRPEAYMAWKAAQEVRLRTALEQRWPGLGATITRTWTASPLTFRDYLGGRDGGSMGLSHDLGALGSQGLSPRSKLRNVLFTGQSFSHPGILGTMIGASITVGALIGRDLRAEVLAACSAGSAL